jgi:hypothetical protein
LTVTIDWEALRTGAVRAADLPCHQPRFDPNLISLYRHQRVPPCIQHGPPAAVPTTGAGGPLSSQLNSLGTLTVTTRQTNTPTTAPAAVRNFNDGQQPRRRYPERRSTPGELGNSRIL